MILGVFRVFVRLNKLFIGNLICFKEGLCWSDGPVVLGPGPVLTGSDLVLRGPRSNSLSGTRGFHPEVVDGYGF